MLGRWRVVRAEQVSLHEYPGVSLQAKLMIADDHIAVLGSTNLDFRYFALNAESNLVIFEPATARTLASAFERDLATALPLTLDRVRRRRFFQQIGDELARELHTAL